jgi:uncharacterized membrane protein YdjX (TVP38/TMEM64 family)
MQTLLRRAVEFGVPSIALTAISLLAFDVTLLGAVLAYVAYVAAALAVYWLLRVESNRHVRIAGLMVNAGFAAWSVALWVRCA